MLAKGTHSRLILCLRAERKFSARRFKSACRVVGFTFEHQGGQKFLLLFRKRSGAILGRNSHSALGEVVTDKDSKTIRLITPGDFPEFPCSFWISLMNGYGGNSVPLLPNGVTFYIFSDGCEFPWAQPLSLAGMLAPMCN